MLGMLINWGKNTVLQQIALKRSKKGEKCLKWQRPGD